MKYIQLIYRKMQELKMVGIKPSLLLAGKDVLTELSQTYLYVSKEAGITHLKIEGITLKIIKIDEENYFEVYGRSVYGSAPVTDNTHNITTVKDNNTPAYRPGAPL